MAENILVKEQLTEGMIDAGAEITRKLEELGLPINAAFWFLTPETHEWRLLFASPEVDSKGPLEVYKRIGHALDVLGDKAAPVSFSDISVLGSNADLVRLLRIGVPTGPSIGRIRFSRNVINGRYIDDVLIYRAA